MRNLILNQIHKECLSLIANSIKDNNIKILLSYFDEINKYLIIICTDMKIYIFSYKQHSKSILEKEIELELSLSSNSDLLMNIMTEIDNKNNPFIYLIYKSEIESIIIGLKTGELITININENTSQMKKIINESNIKIISMETSPNQEIIVIILSNFKLITLSYDTFSKLNECDLDDGDLSDISKEKECEDGEISFKSNGDLFGVIYKINNGYKCLVRDNKLNIIKGPARADNKIVFSVAEKPIEYLGNKISFMPSGSLIAFFDMKNKKIIFSEKNCLIHGEFKIILNNDFKDKDIKPIILNWNFDSPMILFVFEIENKNFIQIYHRSNYEWTLKYEICKNEKVVNSKFSDFVSNQLFILYENKNFEIINFEWEYTSSLYYGNNFMNNNGEICVVNNNNFIRYSPLGIVNIPPPLSLVTIDNNIGKKNFWCKNFFFSLGEKSINVYKSNVREFSLFTTLTFDYNLNIDNIKKCIFVPFYKKNCGVIIINSILDDEIENENLIFIGYSILFNDKKYIEKFNDEKCIFIKECKLKGYNTGIIFNSVKFEENYEKEYFDENNILSKNTTLNEEKKEEEIKPKTGLDLLDDLSMKKEDSINLNEDKIYFYFNGIEVNSKDYIFAYLSFDINNQELSEINSDTLINVTHNNKNERILYISSSLSYKNNEIIFYLTHNNHFYQNGNLLAIDINSYIIFKHFVLFTQMCSSPYSTLHFIDLNVENLKEKLNPNLYSQNLNYKDFNMRTLERGSTIVTCSNIKVILQMPRGNLETISPRLIILDQIKKLVLTKIYDEAFSLCRKHKINLNFIYDINPILFMENLKIFIDKVNKAEFINLFINSLNNDKCEEYQILFNDTKKDTSNEKINKICIEIRKILQEKKNEDYISSILITYIKQNPPLYLDALKLVQNLKIKGDKKADKALEFLCWIVNANTLFDFALKTYDFELVIMCAKHTQKDPKEYLSYLNKLEEIKKKDPILMKYQINIDQKFYSDALIELSKGGEKYFDKCMELIKQNKLYDLGLSLFNQPINELLYSQIYEAKGDYYENEKNYNNAAMCYIRSKNYDKALKCYLSISKVNEVITLLISTNIKPESELYTIILELTNDCKLKHLNNELEKIYLYLINNKQWEKFSPEEFSNICIKLIEGMISNKMYNNAYFSTINLMRIIKENEKYSSISSELLKKLYDELNLTYDLISNNLQKNYNFFKEKYNRFEIVQQLKKEHPELFIIDINKNDNEEDNVSDSGSVRSGNSKKSSSSKYSKSSKKKNKKTKRNIKEGSPFEEEFLIEILKDFKYDEKDYKSTEEFCDVLNLCKFNSKSNELRKLNNLYEKEVNGKIQKLFLISQINFANEHPEINELFPELNLGLIINNNNNNNMINIKKK